MSPQPSQTHIVSWLAVKGHSPELTAVVSVDDSLAKAGHSTIPYFHRGSESAVLSCAGKDSVWSICEQCQSLPRVIL